MRNLLMVICFTLLIQVFLSGCILLSRSTFKTENKLSDVQQTNSNSLKEESITLQNNEKPTSTKPIIRMISYPGDGEKLSVAPTSIDRKPDLMFQDKYKEENGINFGEFELKSPQFETAKHSGINEINNFFTKKFIELKDARYEFFDHCKVESSSMYFVNYESRYFFSDDNHLSVLCIHDRNTGSIRSWNRPEAYNFDINTGKKISLEDIFNKNMDECIVTIENVLNDYLKSRDDYEECYIHIVSNNIIKREFITDNFLISDKTLIVFFPIYSIAPGACGNIFFEIPFELIF